MPIVLATLFTTPLVAVFALLVECVLDVVELVVVFFSPSGNMPLSAAETARWVIKESVRSLGNSVNEFYTAPPQCKVLPFLRQEWKSLEVWNDGVYVVANLAYEEGSLRFGRRTSFSVLNTSAQQVRLDQQQSGRIVLTQFDVKGGDGCFASVSWVSVVEKTEAPFTISKPRQPRTKVQAVNVGGKWCDRIGINHCRSPKRLWLGAAVVPPTVCPVLLYYGGR